MPDGKPIPRVLTALYDAVASYWLAILLLLLLMLLTLLATLEQEAIGVFEVQRKYFESAYLIHDFGGGVAVPLPGGIVVMALLTLNLICGAILRVRWSASKIGLLITHVGVILLFLSGFFVNLQAVRGSLTLMTNESKREYESLLEWEVAIERLDRPEAIVEYLIDEDDFEGLEQDTPRRFFTDKIPFDIVLSGFHRNSRIVSAEPDDSWVAGRRLKSVPLEKKAEANLPGVNALVVMGEEEAPTLLWGGSRPLRFRAGEGTWGLSLRKQRRNLPFTIRLDKFVRKLYPRTNKPKVYRSETTVFDGSGEKGRKVEISMNKPLRYQGFTLYQSSYGPNQSVLTVVQNPADDYPLWATIVIAFGLVSHFSRRLYVYLKALPRRLP